MNKIKLACLLFNFLFFTNEIFAQSINDGKRFMYYERYKSAKEVFNKVVASEPTNEEAVYWLGQSLIAPDDRTDKDLAEAKALYQSKLSANPNSPLLMAGIGHIELIEGKNQDARNHFEAAISLSQGKSIPVLNAVGYANSNPDQKNGDAAYAIDKLKQATQIKKFNDPDVYVNLGDAYRKNGDGGNAILSYQSALTLDPKYARANYRIGRVYQSQGSGQEPIFMKYYNDAIAQDATYAPVYNGLYNYYYTTNVPKSAEYLEKGLANSDNDPKACYNRASIKYAQGLFNEAITKADECISGGGASPYAKLYGLKALSYNRLNDSLNARTFFDEYFKRQPENQIALGEYILYATILLKFPGSEEAAGLLIDKAIMLDTVEANKVGYLKTIAQTYETQKKYKEAADWYNRILSTKKEVGKTDLYYAGYDYYRAKVYDSAIIIFNQYIAKFPDDIFGHYMVGKSSAGIDSTGAQGLAVPFYEKAIEIGEKAPDKAKVKDQLMGAYKFFIEYYYNVKKDQTTALYYADKGLLLDSADTQLIANRDFISKNDPKAPPKKAAPVKQQPKSKASSRRK